MSDGKVNAASAAKAPNQGPNSAAGKEEQDRINSRKIQGLLDELNRKNDSNLFGQKENQTGEDFLTVLAKQSDPASRANKSVLNAYSKQTQDRKNDADSNVQTSATGFVTEKPKLI